MKRVPLVIGIVSVIMVIALAAHAPTVPQVSQVVEARNDVGNETDLLLSSETGSFDLFTLSEPEIHLSVRRPTTLIPDRPGVRSPFQPSWR